MGEWGGGAWLSGSVDLAASLLQKCQASPKPYCPPQSWKASKVLVLCDSGHVHAGFSLMWLECVLHLPVVWCTMPPCLNIHALSFASCVPSSILSSTPCPPEQDLWTSKSLLTPDSKTSTLIPPHHHHPSLNQAPLPFLWFIAPYSFSMAALVAILNFVCVFSSLFPNLTCP